MGLYELSVGLTVIVAVAFRLGVLRGLQPPSLTSASPASCSDRSLDPDRDRRSSGRSRHVRRHDVRLGT